jgi:hypothetical protein
MFRKYEARKHSATGNENINSVALERTAGVHLFFSLSLHTKYTFTIWKQEYDKDVINTLLEGNITAADTTEVLLKSC